MTSGPQIFLRIAILSPLLLVAGCASLDNFLDGLRGRPAEAPVPLRERPLQTPIPANHFVLDSPGELTSTEWGKTLLLKTGAVALAALGGAYNHFRLRPALEAAPDDSELDAEFRATLIAEAILLTFVTILTAWLIAAAT